MFICCLLSLFLFCSCRLGVCELAPIFLCGCCFFHFVISYSFLFWLFKLLLFLWYGCIFMFIYVSSLLVTFFLCSWDINFHICASNFQLDDWHKLKVNNRNRTSFPKRRRWHCSGIFIFNFKHIWNFVVVFLWLTLNRQVFAGWVTSNSPILLYSINIKINLISHWIPSYCSIACSLLSKKVQSM